jgi:hypothetical protein
VLAVRDAAAPAAAGDGAPAPPVLLGSLPGGRLAGGGGVNAELAARRTAAAAVLADYRAAAASAPASRPPGREWMLRLADMLGLLLDALAGAGAGEDVCGGLEPYCAECGHWTGLFLGVGGWKHYRGDPRGGKRELYDAGHDPVPAWCEPPGRVLSPADVAAVIRALEDAAAARRERAGACCWDCASSPQAACDGHLDDLDAADGYDRLAGMLADAQVGEHQGAVGTQEEDR